MARISEAERLGAVEVLTGGGGGYDPDAEAAFDDFRDTLESEDTTATIWVHRIPLDERGEIQHNAKQVHLFTAPVDRFKLDQIIAKVKTEYMAADERRACIRIIAKVAGQAGNKFNRLVLIEKELAGTASNGGNTGGDVATILRVIQESQERQMAALRLMFENQRQNSQPQKDPIELAMGIVAAMTGMVGQIAKPAASSGSLLEQIETLKALRGLAGDLAGDGGGGGSDDDSTAGIIKAVQPLAVPFLQFLTANAQNNSSAPPAPRQMPPRLSAPKVNPSQPTPAPAATPTAQPKGNDAVIAELRAQLEGLCKIAKDGGDAKVIGELIVKNTPEGSAQESALLDLLDGEAWLETLTGIYPGVKESPEFFTALRATILSAYETENETPPPTPTASAN